MFEKDSDTEDKLSCPYGADYCPKVLDLTKTIEINGEELRRISRIVMNLEITIKNIARLIGVATSIISIIVATIGVINL